MGNIFKKSEEQKVNKILDKINAKDKKLDRQIVKVLLLGTGDSGKSTIFRQAQLFTNKKFDDNEIQAFVHNIYDNIYRQAIILVMSAKRADMVPEDDEKLTKAMDFILSVNFDKLLETGVTQEHKSAISYMWQHEAMQQVWEQRIRFPFFDCVEYFFDEPVISRIAAQGHAYKPIIEDIMHFRNKTTGIVKQKFSYRNGNFELYDVGGQRSERRKWITCFDNVNTVLFVTAINEYDQHLYEDENVMRMDEALKVWHDVANREVFKNIGFLLFLNKYDLFEKKVRKYPFRILDGPNARNTDYLGPDPMAFEDGSDEQKSATQACAKYIAEKFQEGIDPDMRDGVVNIETTVATNVQNFQFIFNACLQQILSHVLKIAGVP